MAAVLTATGAFVYVRVGQQLLDTVDTNLRAQLVEVKANAAEQHALVDQDASLGPTVAAVELPTGEPLAREPSTLARDPVARRTRAPTLFTSRIGGLRGQLAHRREADDTCRTRRRTGRRALTRRT